MSKHLLLVTYTLYPPGQNYEEVLDVLESADGYDLDESCWLLCTDHSAAYWYSRLEPLLFDDDELTVLRVQIEDIAADPGVADDLRQWLKSRVATP